MEQSGEEIEKRIDAFLCNPTHDTCRITEFAGFGHHRQTVKDISALIEFWSVVIPGGPWRNDLFCNAVQDLVQAANLKGWRRSGRHEARGFVDVGWRAKAKEQKVVEVEAKGFNYGSIPDISHREVKVKCLRKMCPANSVIDLCLKRIPGSEIFKNVHYSSSKNVMGGHTGSANVVSNIPRLPFSEIGRHQERWEYDINQCDC